MGRRSAGPATSELAGDRGGAAGVGPCGRAGVRGEATVAAAVGGAGAQAGEAASLVR